MKSKKDYFIDIINSRIEQIDMNCDLITVTLFDYFSDNVVNHDGLRIDTTKNDTNFDLIKSNFRAMYDKKHKITLEELVSLAKNRDELNIIDTVMQKESYLYQFDNMNYWNNAVSDFNVIENYLKDILKQQKNDSLFHKDLTELAEQKTMQLRVDFLEYCLPRIKGTGNVRFDIKIRGKSNITIYRVAYDFKVENNNFDFIEKESKVVLPGNMEYSLNEINEDFSYNDTELRKLGYDKSLKKDKLALFSKKAEPLKECYEDLKTILDYLHFGDRYPSENKKVKRSKI